MNIADMVNRLLDQAGDPEPRISGPVKTAQRLAASIAPAVKKECGKLLPPARVLRQRQLDLLQQIAALNPEAAEIDHGRARKAALERLRAGGQLNENDEWNLADYQEGAMEQRQLCESMLVETSAEIAPLIQEINRVVSDAAADVITGLETRDRTEHENFAAIYLPSPLVNTLRESVSFLQKRGLDMILAATE